ncbi:PREDICTED: polycystic kidney disease protein 1-like 2 [Branchiostoma belcheri]|uniref:Polycystic kidney disease protein 1-like 2 n=1 Tax=Branchiostoma belcheri TaxID=7741 RepID=A0A6P5AAX6_BRABE|nr:PREDICTED: polycystic kidney disease protein 1-like 2 [Branchiostoma belcheri]
MRRSSGELLILLAACIIHVDHCACERLDYERDLCTDARVVVGNKYYTIVDDEPMTFDQAKSTCGSVGGRLASTRYPAHYRAYRELMNTVNGRYRVLLCVSVTHGGGVTTAAVSSWVEIALSPVNILITGGSRRSQSGGYLMGQFQEEAYTIDPDLQVEESNSYPRFVDKWDWTCRLPEGTFIMRVENPHGTSGRDWLPYEQEVTLFPQGYPTCYIRYLPSNDLGPEHSFYWSLKQAPDGFPGVDWGNDTRTGQYQEELIVKDHVPGEYILRLDILTNGVLCVTGNCSYAEWKFTIPAPPANARQPVCAADIPVPLSSVECNRTQPYSEEDPGWAGEGCECREVSNLCAVSPTEGIALTTRFDLSCLDFEGIGAIRYEYYYRTRATATVSTLVTSKESGHYNLLYHGMSPTPRPFKLPSGLAADDFKVFILVEASDQQGTTKTSELELTVRLPPSFEELLTAIDETDAEVQRAIRLANKMEAVHLSTITATTLNNIRAEGSYPVDDWRANRNATATAFRAINELTDGILKGKKRMEVVTMISSQDFQVVVNRTDCRWWFDYENHTVHFTSFEDGTWFRLPPLRVIVKAYARSVLKIRGVISQSRLQSIARDHFCASRGTQVFHSRWRNPFEYATNFSRRDLKVGIGGLHFTDALERKGISGLEEPVEFSILRHNQSAAAMEFDDVAEIVYVPFKYNSSIDPPDMYIFLAPRDPLVSPAFTLYLAYGIKPNASQFDLTTTLPVPANMSYSLDLAENVTVTSDPYSWRMRLGDVDPVTWGGNDTNWYLGIKRAEIEGNDDEGGSSVPLGVYIEPVECVFFDEKRHFWSRRGCEVGPLTSRTHLHCLCDHLTKFSGLVAPNEINFERALKGFLLLKNLIQNPVGIMTCCVLFSFYIALCVPWTRKNDAKDLGKVTTAAIFDDTEDPKPRYYMRVFTGPRVNAGTTAKVSITLHGAARECGPFLLHQPYAAMFERGNVAGFVLCTQTDPGWLTHVRVWHDNSGKEPSWFLDRIIVDDLLLEEQHFFLCNRWLAFDEDDGKIERVLPAAKDEQLVAFSTLFADRTTKDLRDGHIWYSVYGRPASSPFTRTQRVSCCLSIVMCTMLANIMFFGRGDDFDQPEPVNIFGFDVKIPISWPQIVIGLQSAAVVFPINAVIIWIFRSVKPRPDKAHKKGTLATSGDIQKDKSDGRRRAKRSSQTKPTSTELSSTQIYLMNVEPSLPEQVRKEAARAQQHIKRDQVTQMTSPGQAKSQGFLLVFVTTNTAAFFVMLYSFEFGREKTEAWLLIFLTSFLSDLILIQPVKILAMAALFAVFYKKADKREEGKRCDLKQCEDIAKEQKQSTPTPALPGSPDLAQARMVAVRRRKLRTILKEVSVYALFLGVVMLAAYGQKNHMAFHMSNEVQRLVVHGEEMSFEEVSDSESYWTWLEDAAVPSLYPDAPAAGPDPPVYRVGPIRLRQARVKMDPDCLTTVSPANQTSGCGRRYDFFSQDEGRYGEGWLPLPAVNISALNGTNGTAGTADGNSTSPWRFRASEDLQELPYAGEHNVYFGGGYVADTSHNSTQTLATLRDLKNHGWIDRATRAVFTDVTLYSPDANLFSIVTLLVEFPGVGAAFPRWEVHTVRLYRFHGAWDVWMALVYISALAVFTLVFAIREVRKAYNSGALYLMDFWNWVEVIIILQSLAAVATFFYSEAVLEEVAGDDVTGLAGNFVNYRRAAFWDGVYTYVVAALLCSVTLKMTHLLRFSHRASLLTHTLRLSVRPLSGFSVMFFLYFFAFAILMHLTFGLRMRSYSSFARTFEALVTIIAGDLNFAEISTTTGNLGVFVLFLFVLVFNICLIGFFVAIIDESYHIAKEDEQLESTDNDLKGFFKYQMQKLKPRNKAREASVENTTMMGPGYAELKVNVIKRLRTAFDDLDER